MKYSQINEGVEFGDLQSLVSSDVSVAEFEPKTGTDDDVVVIGFFCKDEAPANDIATFIEKSTVDILDTEVSPNPDENGFYLVFVEVENENLMQIVFELLDDVARLTEIEEWSVDFYEGSTIKIETKQITQWLKKK
ncbi:hypothetical protein N8344_00670 [bacterium]|nr:hypothetical protein [bacterium]